MVNYNVDYVTRSRLIICLAVGGFDRRHRKAISSPISSIPSFIVTLAGMLVFRGLTLAVLQGASVGPFPDFCSSCLSKGFIPEARRGSYTSRCPSRRSSSALISRRNGPAPPDCRNQRKPRRRGPRASVPIRSGSGTGSLALILFGFAYQMGTISRSCRTCWSSCSVLDHAVPFRHQQDDDRPTDLRAWRQRQGRQAFRYQDRAADLSYFRQHGRPCGPRRHDFRGAAQYRDSERRRWLRTRRDRGLLHRRRLGGGRRRQGDGRWSSAPSSSA